jgi:hypothetical protein
MEPNWLKISFFGGPYDGAREVLDANKMGIVPMEGFELPHTFKGSRCIYIYLCEFWNGGDEVTVQCIAQRLRADRVGA